MASRETESGSLGAMASDAARSARESIGQTADAVGAAAKSVGTSVAEAVTDMGTRTARTARQASAAVAEHGPEVAAQVEDVAEQVGGWVKRNPLTAVTGAFAAGVLLTMMCRRQ